MVIMGEDKKSKLIDYDSLKWDIYPVGLILQIFL